MSSPHWRRPRRVHRLLMLATSLVLVLPSTALGTHGPHDTSVGSYVNLLVPGTIDPIITVGEEYHGTLFEGIPDGIGVVPIGTINPGVSGAIDAYVNHEQSRVPFDPVGAEPNAADISDSSVTRWRIDIATKTIVDAGVAISDDEGFIRFCSSFMAGPQHGFANYTLLTNEESNDNLAVPAGAAYGSDPSMAPLREAGYSVAYDTVTGQLTAVSRMGRLNHENATVVPGGWNKLAILTGDDTFSAPSSQLYLYTANDSGQVLADKGQLWAFQVTAVDGMAVDPYNASNGANDFLDISGTESFSGRFIHVPTDIARGVTAAEPQAGLESWSNANNVFQFIRVEDIAYDPDSPRTVYFTDTGTAVSPNPATGRMMSGGAAQRGRVFKMVLNAGDPRIVDSLTILADGLNASSNFNRPDNIDVGHNSIMVQEDTGNARIWRYGLGDATPAWTPVAVANQPTAETSGILDASAWFGDGYWLIDVQSHWQAGAVSNWQEEHPPTTERPYW
ncbi:MAG: alkaline phosphatase PhoX, partial [Candidatus Limnocylindria bacterium]